MHKYFKSKQSYFVQSNSNCMGGNRLSNDNLIEEYKTLRQEIMEMDKRKNNLIVYTVIATATIFGFSIQYPSPFIFLLPIIIIIPLGYQVLGFQRSILYNGTYISVVIESQIKELQWETHLKKRRKELEQNKKTLRQLSNYLLFDLLGVLCVVSSITYALLIDNNINPFISNPISESGQLLLTIVVLAVLWFISMFFLVKWTSRMRECYGAKSQSYNEQQIRKFINPKEKECTN